MRSFARLSRADPPVSPRSVATCWAALTMPLVATPPFITSLVVWSGFGGGAVAHKGLTSPPEFHSVRRPGRCLGGRSQVLMFDACAAGTTGRGTFADLVTGDLAGILLFARQDSSPAPTGG